jgi:hypothetical protein
MDQLDEWQRLRELYARMNEGELEVVAAEAYDLTDVARPLLKDEIARRGLKIQLRTERPKRGVKLQPVTDRRVIDLDLEGMYTFTTLEEARRVKQFLNASGVPCFWGPDNVDDPGGLAVSIDDGLAMKVRTDDVPRVRAGLRQLFEGEPSEPDAGDCNFVCPKCHSPEIIFHDVDGQAKYNWSCDACGHSWKDDGVESEA